MTKYISINEAHLLATVTAIHSFLIGLSDVENNETFREAVDKSIDFMNESLEVYWDHADGDNQKGALNGISILD